MRDFTVLKALRAEIPETNAVTAALRRQFFCRKWQAESSRGNLRPGGSEEKGGDESLPGSFHSQRSMPEASRPLLCSLYSGGVSKISSSAVSTIFSEISIYRHYNIVNLSKYSCHKFGKWWRVYREQKKDLLFQADFCPPIMWGTSNFP